MTKKREFVTEVDGHKLPFLVRCVGTKIGMYRGTTENDENVRLICVGEQLLLVSCEKREDSFPYYAFVAEDGQVCGREIEERFMRFDAKEAWLNRVRKV